VPLAVGIPIFPLKTGENAVSKAKPDDKAQSERFKDTARKIGADRETAGAADEIMGRLAKRPPEPKKPVAKP